MRLSVTILALVSSATFGIASSAVATVIEGFEPYATGTAPGGPFVHGGKGGTAEVAAGFSGAITPVEGDKLAYLTTGPGENGTAPAGVDRDGNGHDETDWASMSFTFSATAGEVLSFAYDVLTDEAATDFYDVFEIRLDAVSIASGVVGGGSSYLGTFPVVTTFSMGPVTGPDGSSFFDGHLGWTSVSIGIATTGTHTLDFYVADDGGFDGSDFEADTALLIDDIQLNAATVPEPGAMLMVAVGLVAACRCRPRV